MYQSLSNAKNTKESFLALEEFTFSAENRDKKPFLKKCNFYKLPESCVRNKWLIYFGVGLYCDNEWNFSGEKEKCISHRIRETCLGNKCDSYTTPYKWYELCSHLFLRSSFEIMLLAFIHIITCIINSLFIARDHFINIVWIYHNCMFIH